MEKTCSGCKRTLSITEFCKDKNRYDGLAYYCRACKKDQHMSTRERSRERHRTGEYTTVESKTCSKCKTDKSADEFYRDTSRGDGLTSWCRDCQKIYRVKGA